MFVWIIFSIIYKPAQRPPPSVNKAPKLELIIHYSRLGLYRCGISGVVVLLVSLFWVFNACFKNHHFPLTYSGRLSKISNKMEKFSRRPATCLRGSFREGGEWSPSSDSYLPRLRDLILPANQTKNECDSINLQKKHIFYCITLPKI